MNDPYKAIIDNAWKNIVQLYAQFENETPIMLLDIGEQKIYAYPLDEYKKVLSEKDRRFLETNRNAILSGEKMIVFAQDNEAKKLVSYQFERLSQQQEKAAHR